MGKASALFRTASTSVVVGPIPRVVGVLSTLAPKGKLSGDILEVRLDQIARRSDWLKRCAALQSGGLPVLLTVRVRSEGGDWENDDETRLDIYKQGLRELAAVDVELSSVICRAVAREAARLKKASVISFHDFEKTPPLRELCAIVEKAHDIGSIAKISTMITRASDVEVLRSLLRRRWGKPLCVIGMGRAWSKTRIEFATLGSCLTYGYLDKPTASGQMSAGELVRRLRRRSVAYARSTERENLPRTVA
jgi:3-dehydroquinate dehydratase-1